MLVVMCGSEHNPCVPFGNINIELGLQSMGKQEDSGERGSRKLSSVTGSRQGWL
jgi:hypothetical protein